MSSFKPHRYTLQERLGEGATAVVYAARDKELQRDVAVKVLREAMSMREIARERFRREAHAAAALSHPNLVAVYDAGTTTDGRAYLVMERVPGKSLEDYVREKRPAVRDLVRILEKAARGVAAAHEKGIVHRDLKPANILMSSTGEPKVGDFGMAHLMDNRLELTKTGLPIGTPLYMAPEQVQGTQDIAPSTDVYGLGAILYELLAGRPPHMAEGIAELYGKIANEEPVRPTKLKPGTPPELEAIALKALDKDPARRYLDAAHFADDLARFLEGKPVEARPASFTLRTWRRLRRHRLAAAVGAAALLVIIGVALWGQSRARALEEERIRERREADDRVRKATQESQEARRREEALKRLSNLWARMLSVLEWRQQPSRKPAEIRQELDGLLREVSTYVTDYPDLPQGYYVRARAQHAAGDFSGARKELTRALDGHPDFVPGWALMAQVKMDLYVQRLFAWSEQERNANRKEAAPLLREAEDALRRCEGGASGKSAAERWGLSWTRTEIIHETILLAMKERYLDDNREAAIKRLKAAHEKTPASEYCEWIGIWSGDVAVVIPWLDQAISLSPHSAMPYVNRAIAMKVKGDSKKAIEDLTKAIEINPDLALAYDFRGWYRFQANDVDGTIEDCGRALRLDPNMAAAYAHRGEARRVKGDRPGAIEDATEAISLSPGMAAAWSARGLALLDSGQVDRGLSDLNKAIEIFPGEAVYYLQRALAYRAKKDYARMEKDCDESLRLSPPEWVNRPLLQALKDEARKFIKGP